MVTIDNEKAAMIQERGVDSSKGGIGSLMWKCNNDLTVFGDVENLLVCGRACIMCNKVGGRQ